MLIGNKGGHVKMTAKDAVKLYLARIGAKGGKAKGASKARTAEQARKAVMARWSKQKEKKHDNP